MKRGAGALAQFGAQPLYDDVAVVAAFPAEALRPDNYFVAYKEFSDQDGRINDRAVRFGYVRSDERAAWR